MRARERELLQEYGERLARIENYLENHVRCELTKLGDGLRALDARLWMLLGAVLTALLLLAMNLLLRRM